MKRYIAVVAGLALLAIGARPAGAVAGAIQAASSGPTRDNPTGSPQVAGTVTAADGCLVDGISMAVSTPESHPVPGGRTIDGNGEATQSFSWSPDLTQNGHYVVAVEAVQRQGSVLADCAGTASIQVQLWVEVPPSSVRVTKVQPDSRARSVTLTWQRSAESDLVGYLVYRAHGNEQSQPVYGADQPSSGSTLSFFDDLSKEEGGAYTYSVTALRPSSDWYQADRSRPPVASADSASSSGSATMPPQPKPVTTTTSPKGSSGSNSASGGGGVRSTGKIDFSKFASELNSIKRTTPTTEFDSGFSERLGYKDKSVVVREDGEEAFPSLPTDEKGRPTSLLVFATGMLTLAVAAHLLWLRREVAREPLEAIAPMRDQAAVDGDGPEPDPDADTSELAVAPGDDAAIAAGDGDGSSRQRRRVVIR